MSFSIFYDSYAYSFVIDLKYLSSAYFMIALC